RLAAIEANVAQYLRQRVEAAADFADGLAGFMHNREHLEGRDETVARRRIVGEDDVARLFAPDVVALLAHPLDDVAVSDRRALERKAEASQMLLEAEIGHHRRHD